jgi:hypothetical protein
MVLARSVDESDLFLTLLIKIADKPIKKVMGKTVLIVKHRTPIESINYSLKKNKLFWWN